MSALSVQTMTRLLTQPYRQGGETLELVLEGDAGSGTPAAAYDFNLYKARYGQNPDKPQYVVYRKTAVPVTGIQLQVFYQFGGVESSVLIDVPGGPSTGNSYAIPVPADADASLRITRFKQLPVPLPGAGSVNFGVIALLGNISKLAWVIGSEKDLIRTTMQDVRLQGHISFAHDASLDALGSDLRVPRFPARQYSFDANTIALFHLDDAVPNGGVVIDDTTRFGVAGHSGSNSGAQSGSQGKFGTAFHFGPAGAIEIGHHASFDLPAAASFTGETFFRPDAAAAGAALLLGKGTLNDAGALTTPGWALLLGSFRGFSNNVCLMLFDGAALVQLFADADFADSQFHHAAAVIDRASQRARLIIDGDVTATADIGTLGAMSNAAAIRIGQSSAGAQQFFGTLDEVRFSNTARAEFDPVLGEGDAAYRRRLAVFRRWQLPDATSLLATINSQVQIDGDPNSFVLIETPKPLATSSAQVRIIPAKILAGQSLSADGDPLAKEINVSGSAAGEPSFQYIYLLNHAAATVDYGNDPNNHLMQTVTSEALDSLLQLLATTTPAIAGKLQVGKSYAPKDLGLHSVGRALRLAQTSVPPEQLAVFAHRAGFDYVQNTGADVYVSMAAGEALRIVIEPRAALENPADGSDAFSGHVLDLHVGQSGLPAAGLYRWTVIPWASGQASLQAHPADAATLRTPVENRPHVRVAANAPGAITIRVEYTLARTTVTGTIELNFTIASLADGASITADGDTSADEAATIGTPTGSLNSIYLVTSGLGVNFEADPNNKLMQIVLETPLTRLAGLLGTNAATLQIVKSFDPEDAGFFKLGRAIRLTHPAVDAGLLGALAHQAAFDYVSRQGTQIYCSVADGDKIQIATAPALTPIGREAVLSSPLSLQARFSTLPAGGTYNWSTSQTGNGQGVFDFVLRPKVTFTPTHTGYVQISLFYSEADANSENPFTFEIRLNDALNIPQTIIPKPQYDLLMNILNYFHPIGVEVLTMQIRQHVVEVRENLLNAFPGYTFPDFRI